MITQSRLKELLHYDPDTGVLTWLVGRGGVRAGAIAGAPNPPNGYLRVRLDGKSYYAQRLACLYIHGELPTSGMDHINGIRDDNRWVNLREATLAQNHQNRAIGGRNTSGFQGVSWYKASRKWVASIVKDRRKIHLGRYDTPEAAGSAYLVAKAKFHTFNPEVRA